MITAVAAPTLRPFRASDLDALVNRDGAQIDRQQLLAQARSGPAFTAEVDGVPLGCAGVVLLWPGVGSAWMVLTEEMVLHRLWLTRTVRHFLEDMTRVYRLHRIEAVALDDVTRNQGWLELLGFETEKDGRARHYLSDGRSMVRYERIREEYLWGQ